MSLDAQMRKILDQMAVANAAPLYTLTPVAAREQMARQKN